MRHLIENAKELMERRPVWTRRALFNNLNSQNLKTVGPNTAKHVTYYIGYMFNAGPFRDCLVRFGYDPRKDPTSRVYQSLFFMLEPEPATNRMKKHPNTRTMQDTKKVASQNVKESHLFDGKSVSLDGKTWQVCDIIDPFLQSLLATGTPRESCQASGPFPPGMLYVS